MWHLCIVCFTDLIEMLSRCDRIAYICTLPLYNCYQDVINIYTSNHCVFSINSIKNTKFKGVIFVRVGQIGLIIKICRLLTYLLAWMICVFAESIISVYLLIASEAVSGTLWLKKLGKSVIL